MRYCVLQEKLLEEGKDSARVQVPLARRSGKARRLIDSVGTARADVVTANALHNVSLKGRLLQQTVSSGEATMHCTSEAIKLGEQVVR